MHNVSKLAYCLGEGFASLSWDVVSSPFGDDQMCHEVPLPEVIPLSLLLVSSLLFSSPPPSWDVVSSLFGDDRLSHEGNRAPAPSASLPFLYFPFLLPSSFDLALLHTVANYYSFHFGLSLGELMSLVGSPLVPVSDVILLFLSFLFYLLCFFPSDGLEDMHGLPRSRGLNSTSFIFYDFILLCFVFCPFLLPLFLLLLYWACYTCEEREM